MKAKAAEQIGIVFKHVQVPAEATAEEIVKTVQGLNADESVNGILVQLPLGKDITSAGERLVTEAVSPQKDVDGYVLFSRETYAYTNFWVQFSCI